MRPRRYPWLGRLLKRRLIPEAVKKDTPFLCLRSGAGWNRLESSQVRLALPCVLSSFHLIGLVSSRFRRSILLNTSHSGNHHICLTARWVALWGETSRAVLSNVWEYLCWQSWASILCVTVSAIAGCGYRSIDGCRGIYRWRDGKDTS